MRLFQATANDDIDRCLAIRKKVFVAEQNVPVALEIDGQDSQSVHYLLCDESGPAATLRVREQANHQVKLERMAVLKHARGRGYGAALMKYVLQALARRGVQQVKLSAQCTAIGFYERLGFQAYGDIYLDAGIEHSDMVLELSK